MRTRWENQLPDAPWIKEAMATGYSTWGWWNQPPKEDYDDECDEDEEEPDPDD